MSKPADDSNIVEDSLKGLVGGLGLRLKKNMLAHSMKCEIGAAYWSKIVEYFEKHKPQTEVDISGRVPFPDSAWIGLFQEYRELVGPCTEAPDSYHWAWFLVAIGLRLGRSVYVENPLPLYPNFFTVINGTSGITRKSTVPRLGKFLLPTDVQTMHNPQSAEAIYDRLAKRHRVLIDQDEFRTLLTVAKRQGTSDIISRLNKLYTCPPEDSIERRGDETSIKEPFLSLISCAPEGWLSDVLTTGEVIGGFLNRFLFVDGKSKPPLSRPPTPDPEAMAKVLGKVVAATDFWIDKPARIEFGDDAKPLYDEIYTRWYNQQIKRPPEYADLTSRIPDHILKIAMVYSVVLGESTLTAQTISIGHDIAEYLEKTVVRLFGDIGQSPLTKIENAVQAKLRNADGRMGLRDLQRSIVSKNQTLAQFNQAILNLKTGGIVHEETIKSQSSGQMQKWIVMSA